MPPLLPLNDFSFRHFAICQRPLIFFRQLPLLTFMHFDTAFGLRFSLHIIIIFIFRLRFLADGFRHFFATPSLPPFLWLYCSLVRHATAEYRLLRILIRHYDIADFRAISLMAGRFHCIDIASAAGLLSPSHWPLLLTAITPLSFISIFRYYFRRHCRYAD